MHAHLLIGLTCLVSGLVATRSLAQGEAPAQNYKKLAPHFQPPAELANDLGPYRTPLQFADGTPVRDAAGWSKRRAEIRKSWHDLLGPWPAMVTRPTIEYLAKERRDNFTQHHVRIQTAPERFT